MKKKGSTADNKERRLQTLEKILEEANKEGRKPSPKEILTKLAKKGFKISKTTLYDDYTELAINDSFVQDLANKSYSKLVHDCFDAIDYAERKAMDILERKWTRSKDTKREVFVEGAKETVTEKTITEEMAEPKLKAISEIRECAVAKVKLLGGDIIKISAKRWSIQRIKDKQRIEDLNRKIQELKEKLSKDSNNTE